MCACSVIMTALVQPMPRQPTRPACLPLQNDTRPEDEVWDFGTIFHTRCGRPEGWIIRRLPPFSLHSIFLSHFSLLPLTPPLFLSLLYLLPSLPLELSIGSQIHICAIYIERERERETPVGGLCCGYTLTSLRIHGSESGNTEDCFLHSTHHKNGFILLFLCICLMLVIFRYALPLFSFFILTEFLSLFHTIFFCALFDPQFESPRHMSFVQRCSLAFRW